MHPTIQQVRDLIARDRLEQAVDTLTKALGDRGEELAQDLISTSARLNRDKKHNRRGLLTAEEHDVARTKIRFALLEMLPEVEVLLPASSPEPSSAGLSGSQMRQLHEALLDAFDKAALEQMLSFELDRRLGTIVGDGGLGTMVFSLIETAEREGWIADLLRAAPASNPGNTRLAAVCRELEAVLGGS